MLQCTALQRYDTMHCTAMWITRTQNTGHIDIQDPIRGRVIHGQYILIQQLFRYTLKIYFLKNNSNPSLGGKGSG